MKLSPRSILFGASVTAVVAGVAAGLIILGSPAQERERRIDDRRVADLHGIVAATDLYWTRHSRLPASLDDLTAEPGLGINTRDPASSETYGYQALDTARYEVCATFDTESGTAPGESIRTPPIVQASCQGCHGPGRVARTPVEDPAAAHLRLRNLWAHGGGRQCFQLQAQVIGR